MRSRDLTTFLGLEGLLTEGTASKILTGVAASFTGLLAFLHGLGGLTGLVTFLMGLFGSLNDFTASSVGCVICAFLTLDLGFDFDLTGLVSSSSEELSSADS